MKTTPAVQNEMVYTISLFPWQKVSNDIHAYLFLHQPSFFLCLNKDNIRKFFI